LQQGIEVFRQGLIELGYVEGQSIELADFFLSGGRRMLESGPLLQFDPMLAILGVAKTSSRQVSPAILYIYAPDAPSSRCSSPP